MPLVGALFLLAERTLWATAIYLVEKFRTDSADLLIRISLLTNLVLTIEYGMNVQSRSRRPPRELADAENELLL